METLISIESSNSLDYVNKAINNLNHNNGFINHKASLEIEKIEQFKVAESICTNNDKGWYQGAKYIGCASSNIAQVSFTSGTEGNPKAILISHKNLLNTTKRLVDVMQMNSSIKEYIGVPVNFSFGFGRCRAVSFIGGDFYIPPNGFNPLEIIEMLEGDEINAISAVPTLWRLVLEMEGAFKNVGHKVKWIEIGSQFMGAQEKLKMRSIFPNAIIVQHYGLTEASRSTFLRIDTELDKLDSVGKVIADTEIKIDGTGRIAIKGDHVAQAMIKDGVTEKLTDKTGFITTNDIGRIEDGYLYYEGRGDDLINCGGVKLSPESIEQALFSNLEINNGLAIVRVSDPLKGETILLCLEKKYSHLEQTIRSLLTEYLKRMDVNIGNDFNCFILNNLPLTETNKVQRKVITKMYSESEVAPSKLKSENNMKTENQIGDIWKKILKVDHVNENESFFDLGGDSLSAIQAIMEMERIGVPKEICKGVFLGKSISELTTKKVELESETPKDSARLNISLNILKGILVLFNIAAHWAGGVVERLPNIFENLNKYLAPIYSSGTPSFAIVFGMGVGAYTSHRYKKNKNSVNQLIIRNSIILALGIFLMAVFKIWAAYLNGETITSIFISNKFYSVILYYFFAVISIPIWLRLAHSNGKGMINMCLLGGLFFLCHAIIASLEIQPSENPLVQPFILMLTAKYNYFEVSSWVLFGMALGHYFTENTSKLANLELAKIGVSIVLISIAISIKLDETSEFLQFPKVTSSWGWLFYLGWMLIILNSLYLIQNSFKVKNAFLSQFLATTGILAFPLFIGHELVIPLKDILTGYSFKLPLVIAMLLFLFAYYIGYKKVSKIYFAKT